MHPNRRDLVIIGGGAGGLVVASVASQLGLKVTLIEQKHRLGGDCLHAGCVPSKTLIRTAEVAALIRRAPAFGLPALDLAVDFEAVRARIREVVEQLDAEVLYGDDYLDNLAYEYLIISMNIRNYLPHLRENSLLITAGDQDDIRLAVAVRQNVRAFGE